MDKKILNILNELTLEEKIALVAGTNFMYTNSIPRLNIESLRMSDGPHGLRVQIGSGDNGVSNSEIATSFPTAASTASSWNENNLYMMGKAMAEEAKLYGVDIILGPGVNIKRNPLAGRNFEYFSEDPYLSGKMGISEVKGVQSKKIGVSCKHFALNNAENYRFLGNSIADNRAIREIYLKPFEMIVKEAKPETIMCSYNKINGTYCSQNRTLLKDILRNEWGFDGLVMTDWGATHDRLSMLKAGLDLEMPGDTAICRKWIYDGINNNKIKIDTLNEAVYNVLKLVSKHKNKEKVDHVDFKKHAQLACKIAEDSAVLLKNDGLLPLKNEEEYLVIGDLFTKMRYQGAGSSMINPAIYISPKMAFDDHKVKYRYAKGYEENKIETNQKLIDEAINKSNNFDKVLLFAGLTDYYESEGSDRDNMLLPKNQIDLINALIKHNKKIILVLFLGSPVELPFIDNINAILNMYLPGETGGEATYSLLFGKTNPSGKLAETWVKKYEDIPYGKEFSKNENEVYKESIFVGYRYFLKHPEKILFPFGYGLSYSKFSYSNLKIENSNDEILLSLDVQNIGKVYGGEVVEIYVKAPNTVFRPLKELKGFKKVYLKPNEKKNITIKINKNDLRYWDIKENRFVLVSGIYEFEASTDCLTPKERIKINIDGENLPSPYSKNVEKLYLDSLEKISDETFEEMSGLKIPMLKKKKPITLESRFYDLNYTFFGKILFNAILSVQKKEEKAAKKLPEGQEKDNKLKGSFFLKRILENNSLITMSMSAGNSCPYNFVEGMMNLANWHLIKGIKNFTTPIKTISLAKDIDKK